MEIKVAKTAGFCFGVKNAVNAALNTQSKAVTLGEIIHNKNVVDRLAKKGINAISSLEEYVDGKVIIRSHGVGKATIEELVKKGIEYVDATCPFVQRIHNIVDEYHIKGYKIIIIGEKNHPEVIGINGWCDESGVIIATPEEAEDALETLLPLAVVCQTTFSYDKYKRIRNIIENSCKTVEIFDTICYTTKERQSEAVELAKTCDVMLVIGDKSSSNTRKLYDICSQYCEKTYLITETDDLKKVVKKIDRLGITAGASTPEELIEEVVNIMSETQEMSNEMLNEEVAAEAKEAVEAKVEVKNEFEAAMAAQKEVRIKAGQRQEVTVISADETGIKVSFGGKTDAFIDRAEVEIDEPDYNPENYPTGMTFVAEFIEKKSKQDMIAMSKKRIAIREKEQKECEEIIKGTDFTVVIEKAVKGGLLSKLGPYTIFIPQSQIRMGFESNLEKYVGKEMKLRMIPGKKDGEEIEADKPMSKRIVASHRVIIEEEKAAKEEAFWSSMEINSIVKGKVKRFTDFGAFVSVNGNDCLAHISDLSWVKVNNPGDVLELNKVYDFLVLNADRETGKVSLGYKQLQKKPYEEAMEKYPVGSIVNGTVERIFNYGAFVSIDRGVDGLVPVSEISYSYIKDAQEAFTVGQQIEAKVIKFDGNKITLSLKALLTPPENEVKEVEITSDDIKENNERRAKANARKFDTAAQPSNKKRAPKKQVERKDEIKSWTSETSGATFADLFKGFDFSFAEEETPSEETVEESVEKE